MSDQPLMKDLETIPSLDSKPGDLVRCHHHKDRFVRGKILYHDGPLAWALYHRDDKVWVLDCGHCVHVKGPSWTEAE